ncbi:MAG: DNA-damage-inducible protein D [Saprospiraceae bacterium]|jgi:DNA-damage-inducible protein D
MNKPSTSKHKLEAFAFIEKDHYFWWGSWYAQILGYKNLKTLINTITKAKKTCVQLGLDVEDNFIKANSEMGPNIKLSKFACFLIAIHADARKPIVKRARAYFLNELDEVNHLLFDQDYLSRIVAREELSELNKKLAKAASRAHVKDFQYFVNEGYVGMYNSTMSEIKDGRGVQQHKDMNDFMSNTELTANIFRVTLTIERLKLLQNPNQQIAAREHWKVGRQIRKLIQSNTNNSPERLPLSGNLHELQRKLIKTQKELNKVLPSKQIAS